MITYQRPKKDQVITNVIDSNHESHNQYDNERRGFKDKENKRGCSRSYRGRDHSNYDERDKEVNRSSDFNRNI